MRDHGQRQRLHGLRHGDAANYSVRSRPLVYNLRRWNLCSAMSAWRCAACAWRRASRCSPSCRSRSASACRPRCTRRSARCSGCRWACRTRRSWWRSPAATRRSPTCPGPTSRICARSNPAFRSLAASSRITHRPGIRGGAEVVLGRSRVGRLLRGHAARAAARAACCTAIDERDGTRVAVVSERFWRQHMHGDPAAVGRTIRLGGLPFEVVGIIRGSFHGLDRFMTSFGLDSVRGDPAGRDGRRSAPGVI